MLKLNRRQRAGAIAVLVGVGGLVGAAFFPTDEYWFAVLAGLGTTMALALPLFLLEREFEARLTETQEGLEDVKSSVGDIGDRVDQLEIEELDKRAQDRIDARRAKARDEGEAPGHAAASGTFRDVYDGLMHGRGNSAADEAIFVPVPHHQLTFRFEPDEDQELISVIVRSDAHRFDDVTYPWTPDKTLEDVCVDLAAIFDDTLGTGVVELGVSGTVAEHLSETLVVAQRRRRADPGVAPLLELATPHWIVTRDTLEHYGDPPRTFGLADVWQKHPPSDAPDPGELRYAWAVASVRFRDAVA